MDVATIQIEIQNEIASIIQLLGKIQSELDELNEFSKPGGPLDTAVKEGSMSTELLSNMTGFTISSEKFKKLSEIQKKIQNSTLNVDKENSPYLDTNDSMVQ